MVPWQLPHTGYKTPCRLKLLDDIPFFDEMFDAAAGIAVIAHGRFQPDRHGVFRTEQGV
jgi:hypothetical protein